MTSTSLELVDSLFIVDLLVITMVHTALNEAPHPFLSKEDRTFRLIAQPSCEREKFDELAHCVSGFNSGCCVWIILRSGFRGHDHDWD